MLNDFKLYNVHAKSAEMKRGQFQKPKINYVKYNRKKLPSNRVKFSSTDGKGQEGIGKYKVKFIHVGRYILITRQKNSKLTI